MYLVDTNVISEIRKRTRSNPGVQAFFRRAEKENAALYISVITIGELHRGVELIKHRGDIKQASVLEKWLNTIVVKYADLILDFSITEARVWGCLRVPHYENALDKQIATTALTYDLTLVTRNIDDFAGTGVTLINPFE